MPNSPFWLDANVLIEAHNRSYPIGVAVTFWMRLAEQVETGNVLCPRRVYKEVAEHEKHQDEVAHWVKTRKDRGLCVYPIADVQTLVGQIEKSLWETPRTPPYDHAELWAFCKGGDPWVIAHAKVQGGTVVTMETNKTPQAKKPRIPDVCDKFDVDCVTLLEMFKILGVTF
jgi:hypothetical protein